MESEEINNQKFERADDYDDSHQHHHRNHSRIESSITTTTTTASTTTSISNDKLEQIVLDSTMKTEHKATSTEQHFVDVLPVDLDDRIAQSLEWINKYK
jgi:hypothetical protein